MSTLNISFHRLRKLGNSSQIGKTQRSLKSLSLVTHKSVDDVTDGENCDGP